MGTSVRLGRIMGIPIVLNYTWFIIFGLVTVSLISQLGIIHPHWSHLEKWGVALATSLLFFASVLTHELAHSVIAVRRGIPVKSITLFIFGGVAEISREATRPGVELTVAIVGPLSSLILGLLFWALFVLLQPVSEHLATIAQFLFPINIALGAFNLVPGFPLDGGRILRAVIWGISHNYQTATGIATLMGRVVAVGLIICGIVIIIALGNILQGMWLVLIGWFLQTAATAKYRQFRLRESLKDFVARDIMSLDYPTFSPTTTLNEFADDRILISGKQSFLISQDGTIQGIVTLDQTKGVPKQEWKVTPAKRVMTPVDSLKAVDPWEEAHRVMDILDEGTVNQVSVTENGIVLGLVSKENVTNFIRARQRRSLKALLLRIRAGGFSRSLY